MVKKNTCIFISGKGTNLKNLIYRSRDYNFPANIKLIISNNTRAYGINYAKKYSIPWIIINTSNNNFENQIHQHLKKRKIQLICLAGYMKIISKKFLNTYGKNIINIHPSLLPKFKGLNTFKKILKKKEIKTGCTVHFVNEKLDSGNIIIKKSFFIDSFDTEKSIKHKTQKLEYLAFPEAVIRMYRYI